jgi:hypothetical protein
VFLHSLMLHNTCAYDPQGTATSTMTPSSPNSGREGHVSSDIHCTNLADTSPTLHVEKLQGEHLMVGR